MTTCSIDSCQEPVYVKSRGLCRLHYVRWWRTGDPLAHVRALTFGTSEEKWWQKVNKTETCWLWTGGLDRHGYGQFDTKEDGKHVNHRAHRFGYKMLVGPIPNDADLDHLCRNHICVNPAHLEPVTHLENVRRGDAGMNNSSKTHCKHGHEFSPENTIPDGRGNGRVCRTCRKEQSRERMRNFRARKKANI